MSFLRGPSATTIGQSATAASHTGDTAEFTFATITVPAGAMGANGRIEVDALWSCTNSANGKTIKVKFGGTVFQSISVASTVQYRAVTFIANRGSAGSQVGPSSAAAAFGPISANPITSAVDTTAAVTILLTGTLALGTETLTLEAYSVKLFV